MSYYVLSYCFLCLFSCINLNYLAMFNSKRYKSLESNNNGVCCSNTNSQLGRELKFSCASDKT